MLYGSEEGSGSRWQHYLMMVVAVVPDSFQSRHQRLGVRMGTGKEAATVSRIDCRSRRDGRGCFGCFWNRLALGCGRQTKT